MASVTEHDRSRFWARLVDLRNARNADVAPFGPDALPSISSLEFGPDELEVKLANTPEDHITYVLGDVGRFAKNSDTLLKVAELASPNLIVEILRTRSENVGLTSEVLEAFAARLLDPSDEEAVAALGRHASLHLLMHAFYGDVDLPDVYAVMLDKYGTYPDMFTPGDVGVLHLMMSMDSDEFRRRFPGCAQVAADWVSTMMRHIDDVTSLWRHILRIASQVVPLFSDETAAHVAEAIKASASGHVDARHLVEQIILHRKELPAEKRAELFLLLADPAAASLFKPRSARTTFWRLLEAADLSEAELTCDEFTYPSAECVDVATSAFGPGSPFVGVLRAARGDIAALPRDAFIDADTFWWVASSPLVDTPRVLEWLRSQAAYYAANKVPHQDPSRLRLNLLEFDRLAAAGLSDVDALPFLSSSVALRLTPGREVSGLVLDHALRSWRSQEHRMLGLGDYIASHIEALGFRDAARVVLDVPLAALMKVTADDPTAADVLMGLVDWALSAASDSGLSNLHTLSKGWEGSLWELMVIGDIALPTADPAAPTATAD